MEGRALRKEGRKERRKDGRADGRKRNEGWNIKEGKKRKGNEGRQ
jgi:hypothetical protein